MKVYISEKTGRWHINCTPGEAELLKAALTELQQDRSGSRSWDSAHDAILVDRMMHSLACYFWK